MRPSAPALSICHHYNLCRVYEALRTTPGAAFGVAGRVWTVRDLLDATMSLEPNRRAGEAKFHR